MIFHPVLNPWLIALIFVPTIALTVFCLVKGRGMLWALRLILVLACCVLLLRPGIPGGSTQTLATDTDVVLVVDTTASIVAEDWDDDEPRLAGIRADVQAIMAAYPGARFALITFDAAAELRLPLTTDTTALASAMEVLRPEVTAQSRGSSIGIANTIVAETLQRAAESAPDRSRMVFYLGDGEQTVDTEPESFAASAEYVDGGSVLGYGTADGGPMKDTSLGGGGGAYIQYQGENALSVIDEENLQTIAEDLGIPYAHRSADAVIELPEAPTTTTDYSESGEVGAAYELYWFAAGLIVLLLAVELAVATARLSRLRGLSAPRSPRSPRSVSEAGGADRVETPSPPARLSTDDGGDR